MSWASGSWYNTRPSTSAGSSRRRSAAARRAARLLASPGPASWCPVRVRPHLASGRNPAHPLAGRAGRCRAVAVALEADRLDQVGALVSNGLEPPSMRGGPWRRADREPRSSSSNRTASLCCAAVRAFPSLSLGILGPHAHARVRAHLLREPIVRPCRPWGTCFHHRFRHPGPCKGPTTKSLLCVNPRRRAHILIASPQRAPLRLPPAASRARVGLSQAQRRTCGSRRRNLPARNLIRPRRARPRSWAVAALAAATHTPASSALPRG